MTLLSFRQPFAWALIIASAAAIVGIAANGYMAIFFILFGIIAWWVWENPEEGFLFFIVISPLLPMLKETQTIGQITLIKDVIIFTLFTRLVIFRLINKSIPYRRNVLLLPLVGLCVWAIIAALRSDSLGLGVLRLRDIGLYIILFVSVLYLDHTKAIMKRRLWWFTASVAAAIALSGFQWFFAQDSAVLRYLPPPRSIWVPRISATLAHPSVFGQYALAAVSLFIPLTIWNRHNYTRLLYGALSALLLWLVVLTYSRAVWLAALVVLIAAGSLIAYRSIRRKISGKRVLSYTGIGAAVLAVAVTAIIRLTPAGPLVASIVDPAYESNEERIDFAVRLVGSLSDTEGIIGKGLGDVVAQNFREADVTAFDIASGASRSLQVAKNQTLVDNQMLKTFIEMGLIGLLIYVWIYWRLGKASWKYTVRARRPVIPAMQMLFLTGFILQSFFIDVWDIYPTNATFWIVAALFSQMATMPEHVTNQRGWG